MKFRDSQLVRHYCKYILILADILLIESQLRIIRKSCEEHRYNSHAWKLVWDQVKRYSILLIFLLLHNYPYYYITVLSL